MALTKYTDAEKAKVASPDLHKRIETGLHKIGKTRLEDCTPEEKNAIYYTQDK